MLIFSWNSWFFSVSEGAQLKLFGFFKLWSKLRVKLVKMLFSLYLNPVWMIINEPDCCIGCS